MNFDKLTIGVIGAGAVGGYYGSLLARAGFDVHLLVRSGADIINSNGLHVQSINESFVVENVRAYTDPQQMPSCDIVLIALKSTSNENVPSLLIPLLQSHTLVVNLQNGLGFEEELEAQIDDINLLAGLCFICSSKTGPGQIHHTDYGKIRLGAKPDYQEELEYLSKIFSSAQIDCSIDNDRRLARWKKLVWNIPYNGICTALQCDTSKVVQTKALTFWAKDLMFEVLSAAKSENYLLEYQFVEQMLLSTEKMRPYKPSMLLDYENQRPLELEYMYLNPIRAAERNGVEMPRTKALLQQLCALDPNNFDPF